MNPADATLQTLRAEVVSIFFGTIFLSIGVTACAIAAIRWRTGARVLVWLGVWSGFFGLQEFLQVPLVMAVLPAWLQTAAPYVRVVVMYLLLVSALLAWRELCIGRLRLVMLLGIIAGLIIAAAGIITFLIGGRNGEWILYNHLLAVFAATLLLVTILVPRLSRLLVITNHSVFTLATLLFCVEVAYTNLSDFLHYRVIPLVASVSFAVLLFALGYVALQALFINERRLLAIETELDRARDIQSSILPTGVPELQNFRIAACYQPMTSVAGDFYQFIRPDDRHLGILIADVSGHGIAAALIASMLKVALHSVAADADNPGHILAGLNNVLAAEMPGQLISAAYLFIDSDRRTGMYSAAGHPPLLRYRTTAGELQPIESNGLLLGVLAGCDYPVCPVPLQPADRIILYTDGITETENAEGESFGDAQLERVIRNHQSQPAPDFVRLLLSEVDAWRPSSVAQQDDITLLVLDIL